ncbi:hypothetical protein PGT21_001222 [Puccinia graminis f. sp. tritici]|uniref:Uncharacterized protein n=1 Tax=Puccinia graminis f. sp. tritici TaxID=56615 RepID=A0A5B0NCR6_PUCGR|nr:hypothetical protein PGT21_001222 [Puccinia graminis f. sp. tritici]
MVHKGQTHHFNSLATSANASQRVPIPSLLPRFTATDRITVGKLHPSPLSPMPLSDSFPTHHPEPTLNPYEHSSSAPPRQTTKKPPVSQILADGFYDEYSDMQHVVARYQITQTHYSGSQVPIPVSASKFQCLIKEPTIRFLEICGEFLIWLWLFMWKKFHALLPEHQDQILPSHRGPSLPQLYKLLIPISGYNLEIEGCVVNSEKVHDVRYQIYRRPDFTENEIKADIIYLPETPLNGPMDVSPLMAAFIHGGHRIVIPQVSGPEKSVPDVGHQSRVIALVLRHLKSKDQESVKRLRPQQAHLGTETISSLGSTLSSSTCYSGNRPVFLLGLGHAALVALSYPLEIGQPIHEFPQPLGSSGALSIPSVSARAEPPRSLMGKLNSFCDSVNSGMTGLGWWAQGTARQARAEFKSCGPLPKIHGIIAIGPMLDPSGSNHKQKYWFKKPKQVSQGIGPASYSPSMNNAVKRLHLNASNIRVPVMIAHGTKEAFSLIEGINSFYGALASADSTLIFCPTLRHGGDLAGDSARNGLANDCMRWIDCLDSTAAITPEVSAQTLCLPTKKQHPEPNPSASINEAEDTSSVDAPEAVMTEPVAVLAGQLEEDDCSTDFSSWFGSEGPCSIQTLSRNPSAGASIHSATSRGARLSSGSYFYSPELMGSISLEMKLDSPHLSSGFSSPAPRTPATDFFPFLPPSAKIIDHHHGPHGVVSVVRSNRDSYQSLSCINIPGSSLGFN